VLLLGYPCLPEPDISEAIGRLGRALAGRAGSRTTTAPLQLPR
jgi:hypothetical protein